MPAISSTDRLDICMIVGQLARMSGRDDVRTLHEDNRAAWNQGAEAYATELEKEIAFLRDGRTSFEPPEHKYLDELAKCDRAIHLQCAGGTDTLSLWRLGAREVIGIDISDRMIETARTKSAALDAPARWIRCDVLDAPRELDGSADLLYTGRGALCWLHDLGAWAAVVHRLLRPGKRLYIFEGHPFMNVWDANSATWRLDDEYGNYFSREVLSNRGWSPEYIGDLGMPAEQHALKHERLWNLGQIVTALVEAGLVIEKLEEHPDAFYDGWPKLPRGELARVPQTFSLLARR